MTNVKAKPSPMETITKALNKEPVVVKPMVEFDSKLQGHLVVFGQIIRKQEEIKTAIIDRFYSLGLRAEHFGDIGTGEIDPQRLAMRDMTLCYILEGYGHVSYVDGMDKDNKPIGHVVPALEIYFKERKTLPSDAQLVHVRMHNAVDKAYQNLRTRLGGMEEKEETDAAVAEIGKDLVEALRAVIKATNLLVETTTGYSGMMDDISKLQHLNILKHIKDPKVELEKTKGNKTK